MYCCLSNDTKFVWFEALTIPVTPGKHVCSKTKHICISFFFCQLIMSIDDTTVMNNIITNKKVTYISFNFFFILLAAKSLEIFSKHNRCSFPKFHESTKLISIFRKKTTLFNFEQDMFRE